MLPGFHDNMAAESNSDQALLEAVGGGLGDGEPWSLVKRKGAALLALPSDERFGSGLELYQPQSRLAQLLVKFLARLGPKAKLLRLVDEFHWREEGFMSWIRADFYHRPQAVLFGNAQHAARRVVVLTEHEQGHSVWKVGFSEAAKRAVREEIELLRGIPAECSGVPQINHVEDGGEFTCFCMPFYRGRSLDHESLEQVIELLGSWLSPDEFLADQFVSMGSSMTQLPEESRAKLSTLKLKKSLRHGDLAPWNLIRSHSGEITAIDWEMAELESGIPCWDLVHFLIQEATLIKKLKVNEALEWVLSQLGCPVVSRFLEQVGWGNQTTLLVQSYLVCGADPTHFEFKELKEIILRS